MKKSEKNTGTISVARTNAVNTAIDRYNEELKNCTKSAEKVKEENKLIKQTLDNLNRTSIREMEASVQVLNERLRGAERGTAEYRQLETQLRRVKTQLTAVGNEQEAVTGKWQRFMNMLNKNWGAITQIIGTFSGLTLTIRKCVGDFAEMDEAMTNVMKYTGQTKTPGSDQENYNNNLKQQDYEKEYHYCFAFCGSVSDDNELWKQESGRTES